MKDERLYARFSLDFPDSPKFLALPAETKWAYVEMVIYSRRMLTDGFLARAVALAKWGASICSELASNDDKRPSLVETEKGYLIHDFAEHQTTKAEIEELREKRRAAGRKGGQASAQTIAQARVKQEPEQEPEQKPSKSKPESETESESSSSSAIANATEDGREDVDSLCDHLARRIVDNGNKPPTIGVGWKKAARLMLDRDNRPSDEAHRLVDWSQDDRFWRSNILSMPKFREKYDQLRLRAEEQGIVGVGAGGSAPLPRDQWPAEWQM